MSGDLSEEIKLFAEKYKNAPDSRVFAPLADAYRKSGLVDKSVEICEEGIKKYPDYASAHVILGKCFYDKGATERSRREFERVLEIDSENMVALKFMGDILIGEDKSDEAADYYRKLLAIDPTNKEICASLEEIEKEFRGREIDLENEESVKKIEQPRDMATMTLAGIYASQGYFSKASNMYRDILEKNPDNEEAQKMIKKLSAMIDRSEKERGEAFGDEVLTISIDDVSRDLVESTYSNGESDEKVTEEGLGKCVDGQDEPEQYSADDEDELKNIAENIEQNKEMLPDMEEKEEKVEEAEEKDDQTGKSPYGKENFQNWLKKIQDKHGNKD